MNIWVYIWSIRCQDRHLGIGSYFNQDLARWALGVDCVSPLLDWFPPNHFSPRPSAMRNEGLLCRVADFQENRYFWHPLPDCHNGPPINFIISEGLSRTIIALTCCVIFSGAFRLISLLRIFLIAILYIAEVLKTVSRLMGCAWTLE